MCFSRSVQLEKVKKNVFHWFRYFNANQILNRIDFSRFHEYITPVVSADAGTKPNESTVHDDTSDDESLSDDQQVKKKPKREKVGFRDRKVNALAIAEPLRHCPSNDVFIFIFGFSIRCFCC